MKLSLRLVSALFISFFFVSSSIGVVTPRKSSGAKVVFPPMPCTEEDCGFVCRHPDLLPYGCPGVNCYCLEAVKRGVVTPGKSSGAKVYLPPMPCTEEDCGFVCRHPDLLPYGCPGVNCYCLEAVKRGVVTPGKSSGAKVYLPPMPCTEEDCGFVCRHPDLLPSGCPGVNCYCLANK